ncbi:MAG: LysR substrate-binding domain-containing protein [Pseudomonadota bacterium]
MKNSMPSLNTLRAFEAVSRLLSYRVAADELSVTPSAVKHLVAKLEVNVGAQLVKRKGHGLELTPLGMSAKADLSQGMLHFSEAVRKMRAQRTYKRVIVTVEASLATTWLSPRLEKFWERHPEIDLILDISQQVKDLNHSDVDVAIRYGVKPEPGLTATRLFEDLVFPACGPLLVSKKKLKSLDQLNQVPLIHWDMSQMHWAKETRRWFSWENWLKRVGLSEIDATHGKRFSDYSLAAQAAASGQGVILAGWPAMADAMDAGLLVCPFKNGIIETDIGFDLVTLEGVSHRPEVILFIDWIKSIASQMEKFR